MKNVERKVAKQGRAITNNHRTSPPRNPTIITVVLNVLTVRYQKFSSGPSFLTTFKVVLQLTWLFVHEDKIKSVSKTIINLQIKKLQPPQQFLIDFHTKLESSGRTTEMALNS